MRIKDLLAKLSGLSEETTIRMEVFDSTFEITDLEKVRETYVLEKDIINFKLLNLEKVIPPKRRRMAIESPRTQADRWGI